MPTLWSSEVNNTILEQVKVVEWDYVYMLQSFKKKKTMYTKLVPETVHYAIFTSNFIWNDLYLFIICIIYLESSTKYFLQLEHHIELLNHQLKRQYQGQP